MTQPSAEDGTPRPAYRAPTVLAVGTAVAGVAMLLVIALAGWSAFQRDERQRMVEHTMNVRQEIARTLSLMQDAETGQRGYQLTRNAVYLEPYNAALVDIEPTLDRLGALIVDNAEQVQRLGDLRTQVEEKLAVLKNAQVEADAGQRPIGQVIADTGRGRESMDRIRLLVANMDAAERRLLVEREAEDRASRAQLMIAILAAAIVALVLGVMLVMAFRRFASALSAQNAQLAQEMAARQEIQHQLVQSQKMEAVGQLTGGIAHDFNNMLAVVISALSLARRRMAKGDQDIGKFIEAAEDGAKRAATLTSRLLAFARRQPLKPELIDPNKLVGGMSELLRRTLGEQIEVETVLAGGVWRASVDANQLESCLLNLAVNARDALGEGKGGRITLETTNCHLDDGYAAANVGVTPGQYVMISVTDNGPGMPADVMARAFEPFFTTKPVGKGTGLGLSQVYGFVKQSEGHIKIYSEVGSGTTVKIYLPRAAGQGMVATTADVPVDATPAVPGAIILVVEDDEHVRSVTVAGLRELGYVVVHAHGGAAALEQMAKMERIDLLFTDVVMPEMTGRELADRALALRPDLRVLYTTGYTRNAIVHNGVLDAGAELLMKPFSLEQLAQKVAKRLAS